MLNKLTAGFKPPFLKLRHIEFLTHDVLVDYINTPFFRRKHVYHLLNLLQEYWENECEFQRAPTHKSVLIRNAFHGIHDAFGNELDGYKRTKDTRVVFTHIKLIRHYFEFKNQFVMKDRVENLLAMTVNDWIKYFNTIPGGRSFSYLKSTMDDTGFEKVIDEYKSMVDADRDPLFLALSIHGLLENNNV